MKTMLDTNLSKKDRKELIRKISKSSGIAQYALEAKISDVHLIELSQNLGVLELLKKSNDYNRYCQGQKTAEANAKLKEFINLKNSEIIKAGKWLFNALSKTGDARKSHLLEKGLVHKDNYNETLENLKQVIEEQRDGLEKQTQLSQETIKYLEERNDELRNQLEKMEEYITNNFGLNEWNKIRKYFEK